MTRIYITADQLHPGDIVINPDTGDRVFAAFDLSVEVAHRIGAVNVRVWSAVADQEDRGIAPRFDLAPDLHLLVEREDHGPQTTHTVLTYQADGSVEVTRR